MHIKIVKAYSHLIDCLQIIFIFKETKIHIFVQMTILIRILVILFEIIFEIRSLSCTLDIIYSKWPQTLSNCNFCLLAKEQGTYGSSICFSKHFVWYMEKRNIFGGCDMALQQNSGHNYGLTNPLWNQMK